jgi:hypothetical protein
MPRVITEPLTENYIPKWRGRFRLPAQPKRPLLPAGLASAMLVQA